MAPKPKYIRFWCTKCQEFTLHNTEGDKACRDCGTVTTEYNISDVLHEKILEQRKRYKAYKAKEFENAFSYVMKPQLNIFQEMMLEDAGLYNPYEPEIIEDDAGQKKIDAKLKAERDAEWNKQQEEKRLLREEYKQFSKLGRNDKCACGSGKKYKVCCIAKYQNI